MTLTQIDEALPNGFHDAEIQQLVWAFQQGSITFEMDFWVPLEETDDRDKRRRGTLELSRLHFVAFDRPKLRQFEPKRYRFDPGTLQIDGIETNEKIFPDLSKIKANLPPDAEFYSFYVTNWNSYIHVAAGEAKLIWREP